MHTKKDRCGLTVNGSLIDNARLNKQSTIGQQITQNSPKTLLTGVATVQSDPLTKMGTATVQTGPVAGKFTAKTSIQILNNYSMDFWIDRLT